MGRSHSPLHVCEKLFMGFFTRSLLLMCSLPFSVSSSHQFHQLAKHYYAGKRVNIAGSSKKFWLYVQQSSPCEKLQCYCFLLEKNEQISSLQNLIFSYSLHLNWKLVPDIRKFPLVCVILSHKTWFLYNHSAIRQLSVGTSTSRKGEPRNKDICKL